MCVCFFFSGFVGVFVLHMTLSHERATIGIWLEMKAKFISRWLLQDFLCIALILFRHKN